MWNYNNNGYLNNNNFYNGLTVVPVCGLWQVIVYMVNFEDLLLCADEAAQGKRKSKETVKFMINKEFNTVKL